MKHATKSMLTTALILFTAGLILTLGSFIFCIASGVELSGDAERNYDIQSFNLSLSAWRDEADAINKTVSEYSISSQVGSIEVISTDGESHLEFSNIDRNNLLFSYQMGVLSISEKEPNVFFGLSVSNDGFSFVGLRHIFSKNNFYGAQKIKLFWNRNDSLSALSLNVVAGSVHVSGIKLTSNLSAQVTLGDLTVQDCTSAEGSLSARATLGTVTANNNDFSLASLYTTLGTIHTTLSEHKTTAESVLGSINAKFLLPADSYNLRCTTTIGKITLPDGSSVGAEHTSSLTDGENSFIATTIIGSVRISA